MQKIGGAVVRGLGDAGVSSEEAMTPGPNKGQSLGYQKVHC
jgi:hypothetical protein